MEPTARHPFKLPTIGALAHRQEAYITQILLRNLKRLKVQIQKTLEAFCAIHKDPQLTKKSFERAILVRTQQRQTALSTRSHYFFEVEPSKTNQKLLNPKFIGIV